MGRNGADSRSIRARRRESLRKSLALSVFVEGVVNVERLLHFVSKGRYK